MVDIENNSTDKDYEKYQGIINEYTQLLEQKDYMARKVVFEIAEKFKEAFPAVALPEYTKYKDIEAKAVEYRQKIEEAREHLK